MATYFADFVHGNDASNGLGPDASHATNKPWKTLTKALGAAGIASGDTLYLSPAGIFRETLTVAMTSATAETKILADPTNAQGFKSATGVLVAPGDVILSGWTTSDVVAGSASSLIAVAGRDFLTFEGIRFEAYNGKVLDGSTTASTNITIRRCAFPHPTASGIAIDMTCAANVPLNLLIEQCTHFGGSQGFVNIVGTLSGSADYDVGVTIRNCESIIFGGTRTVNFVTTGAGAFKPGGGLIMQCDFVSADSPIRTQDANWSTSIPAKVYESLLMGRLAVLNANVAGQIIEDWNVIYGSRTNVTAGANSISGSPPARNVMSFDLGYAALMGRPMRPYFEPRAGSPILGFVPVGSETGEEAVDLRNRPRPAGGASVNYAAGPHERHDTALVETSTFDVSPAQRIDGPGDQDFLVMVDASATTIGVSLRYDTNHGTTNKPQFLLLAEPKLGVTAQTLTMTVGVDTWEVLETASFTPTAAGVVRVRVVSRAAAGTGKVFYDTFV